mmetsp:Transcript_49668/g.159736  ORF Transcript_49668/g.159736 Transcript_49668/m.159736 type:complete len:255 (-) Transcript_49668:1001-1765(-)
MIPLEGLRQHALFHDLQDVPDLGGIRVEELEQVSAVAPGAEVEGLPPSAVHMILNVGGQPLNRVDLPFELEATGGAIAAQEIMRTLVPHRRDAMRDCHGIVMQLGGVQQSHARDECRNDRENSSDQSGEDDHYDVRGEKTQPTHDVAVVVVEHTHRWVHEGHHPSHVPTHAEHDGVPRGLRDQEQEQNQGDIHQASDLSVRRIVRIFVHDGAWLASLAPEILVPGVELLIPVVGARPCEMRIELTIGAEDSSRL